MSFAFASSSDGELSEARVAEMKRNKLVRLIGNLISNRVYKGEWLVQGVRRAKAAMAAFARRTPAPFLAIVGEVEAYLIAKFRLMNAKYASIRQCVRTDPM